MKRSVPALALAVAAVLVLGLAGAAYLGHGAGDSSPGGAHSLGQPLVVAATSAGTPPSASSSTTTSVLSSGDTTAQTTSAGGAYTSTPSSQVKVVSLTATVSGGQPGSEAVTFTLVFQNAGAGTVYVVDGGGSALNATIVAGPVSVVHTNVRCETPVAMVPVLPGQDHTSATPGCWSGAAFVLDGPGTVDVSLTLTWSGGASGGQSGSMTISAEFPLE